MLAGMHDLLLAASSYKTSVCRSYKNTMLRHVAEFLTAVKASLVKLGVDESRLQRITQEVGPLLAKRRFLMVCLSKRCLLSPACCLTSCACLPAADLCCTQTHAGWEQACTCVGVADLQTQCSHCP